MRLFTIPLSFLSLLVLKHVDFCTFVRDFSIGIRFSLVSAANHPTDFIFPNLRVDSLPACLLVHFDISWMFWRGALGLLSSKGRITTRPPNPHVNFQCRTPFSSLIVQYQWHITFRFRSDGIDRILGAV
jgi:hypothetical protein